MGSFMQAYALRKLSNLCLEIKVKALVFNMYLVFSCLFWKELFGIRSLVLEKKILGLARVADSTMLGRSCGG